MIYLLWALLNFGLLLFFLVICFKATKLVREKMGGFTAIVFVLGLLSFVSNSDTNTNKEPNSNKVKTWNFNTEDDLIRKTYSQNIDLENTLISKNTLTIKYGKKDRSSIPISAYTNTTGFAGGIVWIPSAITVNPTAENKFAYSVHGITKWKLLGATIYYQPKVYGGVVQIK